MKEDENKVWLPHGSEMLCFWCMKQEECSGEPLHLNAARIYGCTEFVPDLAKIKEYFGTIKIGVRGQGNVSE